MTAAAWKKFAAARERCRSEIERLNRAVPELRSVQQKLADSRQTKGSAPAYMVETPIVYNRALDDIAAGSDIRLILVADNPGRREQAAENRRYLVGPSGKIAEKFFRDHPSLNIDFRAHVIILNKTPIHTPRTVELKELCKLGGDLRSPLAAALDESQRIMAGLLREFYQALKTPIWICGYSEMKKGGVFEAYTSELKTLCQKDGLFDQIFLYRHFSMNQFTIDLNRQAVEGEPLNQTLARIGAAYREKYLSQRIAQTME